MKKNAVRKSGSKAIDVAAARKNIAAAVKLLKQHYPQSKTALDFRTPLQMLVSTILSAQCTDKRVNMVTPALFARYKTAKDFADADMNELQTLIRSTGFYKNKAKNIQGAAKMIAEKFRGKVPRTMEEMLELPGVARKTANVVLDNAYGVVEGVVVDTHVGRLSRRLGFTAQKDASKVEKDLMVILPRKDWSAFSYMLIDHGRAVCKSVKPDCSDCFLNKICPSAFSFDAKGRWIGVK
jgi:endonuclease-3